MIKRCMRVVVTMLWTSVTAIPNIVPAQEASVVHDRIFNQLASNEGILETFVPVDDAFDATLTQEPLMLWGIFNPMGPTISTLSLLSKEGADRKLLYFRMLNPFAQENLVVGSFPVASTSEAIVESIDDLFATNTDGEYSVNKGMPTFVWPLSEGLKTAAYVAFWQTAHISGEDIARLCQAYKRFMGEPWERTQAQVRGDITTMRQAGDPEEPEEEVFWEWVEIMADREHYGPEIMNLKPAWEGALGYQRKSGNAALTADALEFEDLNRYLHRIGVEFLGEPDETPVAESGDLLEIGRDLLESVFSQMQIDEEWSVREDLSFTWWGGALAQRVWVTKSEAYGEPILLAFSECDLLRNVSATTEIHAQLSGQNAAPSLSALVYIPESRKLVYRAAVVLYPAIAPWISDVFLHVVALQVADAHKNASELASLFAGTIDRSAHPDGGKRTTPDGMLGVVEDVYVKMGLQEPPWTEEEFGAVAQAPSPSVATNYSERGLTAEFPYFGEAPAFERVQSGLAPETALFRATVTQPHDRLGSGCLLSLSLPVQIEDPSVATRLNQVEAQGESASHFMGAWHLTDGTLTFETFLPTAVHRSGLLTLLYQRSALRGHWAKQYLESIGIVDGQ